MEITWDGVLLPNTTYAFYLNGTVSDITEKNDSLYAFVFSTGNELDSLSLELTILDAISNEPKSKVLVGLWENYSDSVKPKYVAQSDQNGLARFSYLKKGTYQICAFEDKNRNLLRDRDESFGYLNESVVVDTITLVPPNLRVSPSIKKDKIRTIKFLPPNALLLGTTAPLENASIRVNDKLVDQNIRYFTNDSLLVYLPLLDTTSLAVQIESALFSASDKIRVSSKSATMPPTVYSTLKSNWKYLDTLVVYASSKITAVDLQKVEFIATNAKDTTKVEPNGVIENGTLSLFFSEKFLEQLKINFLPNSVKFENNQVNIDTIALQFNTLTTKNLGNLNVRLQDFPGRCLVSLMQGKEVIKTLNSTANTTLTFNGLLPNEYTIRVLLDSNGNGIWDDGNRAIGTQPEKYLYFSEKQKIRANWDLDLDLNYGK